MKETIIIVALAVASLVSLTTAGGGKPTAPVSEDSLYWQQRAEMADAIIDSIFAHSEDSYICDVLMETDLWDDYCKMIVEQPK